LLLPAPFHTIWGDGEVGTG